MFIYFIQKKMQGNLIYLINVDQLTQGQIALLMKKFIAKKYLLTWKKNLKSASAEVSLIQTLILNIYFI